MISTYPRFYFWVQLLFLGPAFNMGPTFILCSYSYCWVLHSFSGPTSILRSYLICGSTLILSVPSFMFGSYNLRQDLFLWKSPSFNYICGSTYIIGSYFYFWALLTKIGSLKSPTCIISSTTFRPHKIKFLFPVPARITFGERIKKFYFISLNLIYLAIQLIVYR